MAKPKYLEFINLAIHKKTFMHDKKVTALSM